MEVIKQYHEILTPIDGSAILKTLEEFGRVCYKSENKICTGSAEKFVRMILKGNHESVLEHVSISVRFVTDRGVTHEIVRHRLASYSQESTRYVKYSNAQFIAPVDIVEGTEQYKLWEGSMRAAETAYMALLNAGATPQQARAVLPNSTKTELIMTANLREWRHFLKLRTGKGAHPQVRALATDLLVELKNRIPIIFEDIED